MPVSKMLLRKLLILRLLEEEDEDELEEAENAVLIQMILRRQRERERGRPRAREGARRPQRRPRTCWVEDWLLRRQELGAYYNLMVAFEEKNHKCFKRMVRLSPAEFHEMEERLTPRLQKQLTFFRKPIEPGHRLAITLAYLASGVDYVRLGFHFHVAWNTVSVIVPEVCQAIIDEYGEEALDTPVSPEQWVEISRDFLKWWNVPNALGALDGKHIRIRCPRKGGSHYYNYKGFHSIILLALADANYKFRWVDIGANGACSDAQVFNHCELLEVIEAQEIGFPEPAPLPNDDVPTPFFLLGDDAFALRTWLMKPYSRRNLTRDERIYNFRISRGRRVVENAFGLLVTRYRCLLNSLQQEPQNVRKIVLACVILHNLHRTRRPTHRRRANAVQGIPFVDEATDWECPLATLQHVRGPNRASTAAKRQQVYLTEYFNSAAGAVSFQDDVI